MKNLVQLSELEGVEILEVRQIVNRDRDRPDFDNRYFKMLYFIAREGIGSTFRKYFAHKQEQVRYLTFLTIIRDERKYLNISVQSQEDPSQFVIANLFYPSGHIDEGYVESNIEKLLKVFNQYGGEVDYGILNLNHDSPLSLEIKIKAVEERYDTGLFIYGLGGYVRMFIMHHFKRIKKIACIDYKSKVARSFQLKYGFLHSFLVPRSSYPLLKNVERPVVIIATYHSDHATIAEEVYETNQASEIFIEKPPAVTLEDLDKLINLYKRGARLQMGFNRRFISFSQEVRSLVRERPVIVTCSVKEVVISPNHWYFWENQGTRITGNVVHWFDLANYWIQSLPVEINVMSGPDDMESSSISVLYEDGSILNITASDRGNSLRGVQEKIEIRSGNETIFIDDFNCMVHQRQNGIRSKKRKFRRDKGHSRMYRNFAQIIDGNSSSEYTVTDLINASVVTYTASKMIREGIRTMRIEETLRRYHEGTSKIHSR